MATSFSAFQGNEFPWDRPKFVVPPQVPLRYIVFEASISVELRVRISTKAAGNTAPSSRCH
jgi:hypothetical protein